MNKTAPTFVLFIAVVALTPMATATSVDMCADVASLFTANGHYYQIVIDENIPWDGTTGAENTAEDMQCEADGIVYDGHLAIITTAGEDAFVEALRATEYDAAIVSYTELPPEFWVGGFQSPPTTDEDANWNWVIPEAPFDNYTNWQSGEPNDFDGTDEMFLGIGHTDTPGWNDEASVGNIGGYVVEFDVNAVVFEDEDLDECLESSGTGCSTTPGGAQNIEIPDSAVQGLDPSLSAATYRFTDNPDRCGDDPLVLFGGDLIISPNHCATPETGYEFIVVFTEATGINLQEGTIRVVQDAKAALPDFPYTCDEPIPTGVSANDQEVVIYQRTNKGDMREFGRTWGPFTDVVPDKPIDDADGATSDITDSCGSSRARRAENSWSVIGMVQHFDDASEMNPDVNRLRWRELARFKLELLQEAVLDSESALSRRDFKQISKQAFQALKKFDQANDQRAIVHLDNLLRKVEGADYDSSATGNNDQGEAIERAASVRFIIATKIPASGQ